MRVASWSVVALPLVVVLAGGWSYHWFQEDAYISVRVIDNLLAGHGPVYNIGERVEVFTDPLWVFLVAAVHGIVPVISVEWDAVLLGLLGTGFGVALAGRAAQRLGGLHEDGLVVPIGLVIFSVVGGVWEFSTSGLEMGAVFCWIGLSFWLLVRTHTRRDSGRWCAFVVGLGPLIRPELLLMAVVFLGTLGLVVYAARPERRTYWRGAGLLVVAVALPVLYQLFRMAYFALVVPNTALAKAAGGSAWAAGLSYVWNFLAPYTLWLPLALAAMVMGPLLWGWWARGVRVEVAIVLGLLVAGLLDAAYVVKVGGDYMHARLLLPAFDAIAAGIFVPARNLRRIRAALPVVGIVLWAVVCLAWLRVPPITFPLRAVNDERSFFVRFSGQAHPMSPNDFQRTLTWHWAHYFHELAAATAADNQKLQAGSLHNVAPARSPLPFRMAVTIPAAGMFGVVVGPNVYVFDTLSVTNPIGSHTNRIEGRQGKSIGAVWMVARFGIPGHGLPTPVAPPAEVAAARKALNCGPLRGYLHAITAPLDVGQALSNVAHSFSYTTFEFSGDPNVAVGQLCGRGAGRR